MSKQDLLNELWEKYLADQKMTAGELKQLRALVHEARHQPQLERLLTTLYTEKQQTATADTTASEAFEEVWARLQTATPENEAPAVLISLPRRFAWWRYAAAALVIITAASGVYWFSRSKTPATIVQRAAGTPTNIQPGSNKALLKLADGSTISLNEAQNGTLAQQGNTQVVKLANGQLTYQQAATNQTSEISKSEISYNVLTTPRGGKYYITLPDGSKVWLNAASSLRYPTTFTGAAREVMLTGEAYFEIAKNTAMPFRVKVNEMQVDVLGTHFNIMAYADEEAMHTTLLEGSVKVSTTGSKQQLTPGQRASLYHGSNTLKVQSDVDTEEAIAWKNNLMQFAGTDLHAAMRQIARWYDVEVEYKGNIPNAHFRGILSSDAPLAKVLQLMQQTGEVHFEVSGRKIIVTP